MQGRSEFAAAENHYRHRGDRVELYRAILKASRKQAIVPEVAYVLSNRDYRATADIFDIDEGALRKEGIPDFDAYPVTPEARLYTNFIGISAKLICFYKKRGRACQRQRIM